jgi:membrane protein implicated in regulation of membrane protease activity
MPDWVPWLIGAAALVIGEVFTLGFILGPIALAAVLASVVAAVGGGLGVQLLVFIVGSIASLGFVRPLAARHLHTPSRTRTGAAALIGARAVVLERVDADHGLVKIGGETWTARPFDEDQVMEPGTRVEVLKIEGATALVSE